MNNNPGVTTHNRQTHLLAATQFVTLAILLAQAWTASGVSFTKATYNGLFSQAEGTNSVVNNLSSGFLTVSLRESGAFTGSLYIGGGSSAPGGKFPLQGQFDANGKKTLIISRTRLNRGPLTVALEYAPSGQTEILTGQVSATNWTALLVAYQAYSSQPPQAGKYTLQLRTPAADNGPGGIGIGRVSVSLTGKLGFSGKLPDNTTLSQSLSLCKGGRWPLYASLYSSKGSILGWVEFDGANSLNGEIGWTKPAMPNAKYYNRGLTNVVDLLGFSYNPPRTGTRPLNFIKGLVVFSGGPLGKPFTNSVTLSTSGNVNANTSSALKFKINALTGQFSGTAELPGLGGHLPVSGAIFQSPLNQGYGFFLANGQSGAVLLYGDYR